MISRTHPGRSNFCEKKSSIVLMPTKQLFAQIFSWPLLVLAVQTSLTRVGMQYM